MRAARARAESARQAARPLPRVFRSRSVQIGKVLTDSTLLDFQAGRLLLFTTNIYCSVTIFGQRVFSTGQTAEFADR